MLKVSSGLHALPCDAQIYRGTEEGKLSSVEPPISTSK